MKQLARGSNTVGEGSWEFCCDSVFSVNQIIKNKREYCLENEITFDDLKKDMSDIWQSE